MKRSTTEDYPPLDDFQARVLEAKRNADAQLARDIEAARGVKPAPLQIQTGPLPALQRQEGGQHYKDRAIQPIEYIHANSLGFIEGSIVKYITRWRDKGGQGDLLKIKHYVDLLIELEGKQEVNPATVVDDGWLTWYGGDNPVGGARVKILHRQGTTDGPNPAYFYTWINTGKDTDIVAYRVV